MKKRIIAILAVAFVFGAVLTAIAATHGSLGNKLAQTWGQVKLENYCRTHPRDPICKMGGNKLAKTIGQIKLEYYCQTHARDPICKGRT